MTASPSSAKTYTLARLLEKQPKTLNKSRHYRQMLEYYTLSPRLRRIRISRRCYRLLDEARIAPEHLENFYRTYRLPKDPFFPLFFAVKREYLEHRKNLKRQKAEYIQRRMNRLDPGLKSFLHYLGNFEKQLNLAGKTPIWNGVLYPGTKKRADEYRTYDTEAWIGLFTRFGTELQRRYRTAKLSDWALIFAAFQLECLPQEYPFRLPDRAAVNRQYRKLSKRHHPDTGGDPRIFRRLKEARDLLLAASP